MLQYTEMKIARVDPCRRITSSITDIAPKLMQNC